MGERRPPLTDEEAAELREWVTRLKTHASVTTTSYTVLRLLDERDALAEEVATCHRLIALEHHALFGGGWRVRKPGKGWRPATPDEARVLDTVRAGGDEEKATP